MYIGTDVIKELKISINLKSKNLVRNDSLTNTFKCIFENMKRLTIRHPRKDICGHWLHKD